MKTVKRSVLALVAFVCLTQSGFAESVQGGNILGVDSSPLKMLTVTTATASAGDFSAGSLIFGFKLTANDAGDSCTLYDSATLFVTDAMVIDELVEPTDEDVSLQMWPRPYKLVTDLSVQTNGAACIIYYQ